MLTALKYSLVSIISIAFGYAWAFNAYMPHIRELEAIINALLNK